jgi:hypothetical protein
MKTTREFTATSQFSLLLSLGTPPVHLPQTDQPILALIQLPPHSPFKLFLITAVTAGGAAAVEFVAIGMAAGRNSALGKQGSPPQRRLSHLHVILSLKLVCR